MYNLIPLGVKQECLRRLKNGESEKEVYDNFFKLQFASPQAFYSFQTSVKRWKKQNLNDLKEITLEKGTYNGFIAHDATVQISGKGEITQAWIKQKAGDIDPDEFIKYVSGKIEKYVPTSKSKDESSDMLEVPLFDMHWGISFLDHYRSFLDEIIFLIQSKRWKKIVIPFGQDFFHNDSIVHGVTTKGTPIEKVDMERAVKEGQRFIYSIVDSAIDNADEVKVLYSMGNHDRSISWMFMQVLLERYGPEIVDDSMAYRKVVTFGKNAIMVTHGDAKRASSKNLSSIFPVAFPEEFARSTVREVHSGHLHHEEADTFGVMVRRLSTAGLTDDWTDKEDFIGAHKRFMLFVWSTEKLKAIHYV